MASFGPDQLTNSLLDTLRRNGPLTAIELAEALGVHPFGVTQALRRLAAKGLVVSAGTQVGRSTYFGRATRVAVWQACA